MAVRSLVLLALAGCATAGRDDMLAAQFARPPANLAERAGDLAQALAHPPADPALAAELARETQTVAQLVYADVVHEQTPLAEAARAQRYTAFLEHPEVWAIAARLRDDIGTAGRATCAALDASTPFASWLASRYCAHFGVTRAGLALPDRYGLLAIDDEIAGVPATERAPLARALDAALRASPWYAPGAPALLTHLTGSLVATITKTPVTRSVSYRAKVRGSVAEATRYGVYDEPITLWEPREDTYAAIEEHGTYAAQLHVDVEPLGIGASDATSFTQAQESTDASIPDADVEPFRASLLTAEQLAEREGATLAANLRTELTHGFVERACQEADRSYEAAARCAYGDAARAVPQLLPVFGNDAPLLRPLLR